MQAHMVAAHPGQEWLQARLAEAQRHLEAMGPLFEGLDARMGDLKDRLAQGRFHLAVLGQFKRGKSSLLNALLGEPLLPTGVLPLTAIPTKLRHGTDWRLRVVRQNGRREIHSGSLDLVAHTLMQTVTERENPGNRLGISQVEVEHPSPLLAKGVEMLDTPGFGSTMLHNTEAARALLPVCDGALFILSPDPPITEVEVQFLRAVTQAVARVSFVVTKADTLTPSDRLEILAFLRHVLHDRAGLSDRERFFVVSARQGLEARLTRNADLWAQSGLGELEAYLADFLATDKQAALCEAIQAKAVRVIGEALFVSDLLRKAIDLPRKELDRRLERFEDQLVGIDPERLYFHDRLAGDQQRMLQEVDQLAETIEDPAKKALGACAERVREETAPAMPLTQLESCIRAALSHETEHLFGRHANEILAAVTRRFRSIEDAHCREIERLIERIRRTAADLFEVPYLEGVALERVAVIREPRLIGRRWVTSFTEAAMSWITRWLPSRLRAKQAERRLREDIAYLVRRNVEELRWAVRQNLQDAFRTFEARMDGQIEATSTCIRTAVRQVADQQAQREALADPELRRLANVRERLEQILRTLSRPEDQASYGNPL